MVLNNQKVLIVGIGKSGISAAKLCRFMGANISICDSRDKDLLREQINQVKDLNINLIMGKNIDDDSFIKSQNMIITSPGVPTDLPLFSKARKYGLPVYSEIELGYMYCKSPIIAITGTNGKTTTTTLVGNMFNMFNTNAYVLGNIGIPFTEKVLQIQHKEVAVLEVSSFQLETINSFHPKVSAILNITPDHLDRHHSLEEYIKNKQRICMNQSNNDLCILNYDDIICRKIGNETKSKIIYFSKSSVLSEGIFIENGKIAVKYSNINQNICSVDDLKVPGMCENAMAAAAIGISMGIPLDIIAKALIKFDGIEHRIEYVDIINGVTYYNDSKATNPGSTIHAINNINKPIVLIAGGRDDKKSDFTEMSKFFKNKVKRLLVFGDTADKIIRCAHSQGYYNTIKVKNMEEAILISSQVAEDGDCVLMSPACNSNRDLFINHEERGRIFKQLVFKTNKCK